MSRVFSFLILGVLALTAPWPVVFIVLLYPAYRYAPFFEGMFIGVGMDLAFALPESSWFSSVRFTVFSIITVYALSFVRSYTRVR